MIIGRLIGAANAIFAAKTGPKITDSQFHHVVMQGHCSDRMIVPRRVPYQVEVHIAVGNRSKVAYLVLPKYGGESRNSNPGGTA